MYRLPQIILMFGLASTLQAQSPHGTEFKMDCGACHTADSWEISADSWNFDEEEKPNISKTTGWVIDSKNKRFNHYNTKFPLLGSHESVDCRSCHEILVFSEAETDCISCHTDMHNQTVGADCARCHDSENWLVDNISELHEENGFPLLGAHAPLTCNECHISDSELQFNRIGNDCMNCHLDNFNATTNPNHNEAGFSTDCAECHRLDGFGWSSEIINHDFFPLTKGHETTDCAKCHIGGNFANTPTECIDCHQTDFNNASNPNHQTVNFSTNCIECHTTDVGWTPVDFTEHDAIYFPIYSGEHEGEWNECIDCHTNPSNYSQFSCTNCHTNPETDEDHNGINGYSYNSPACLVCHPSGNADDGFDHSLTNFPLLGAHSSVDCISCHANGYQGTPTECSACHIENYNQTTNPDHQASQFPIDCESCHTETGWIPSTFDHDAVYPFTGAHIPISNDCAACHNGDYNNTPNTCAGCHTQDYNQSTNPNHTALNIPMDCASCHTTEPDWMPATFDIHDDYYVLNGAHAMIANDCASCHNGDYNNTPNTCFGCHSQDYNNTTDPNHTALQFSTDCQTCHSESEWIPAAFDHDGQYFPIYSGAHDGEWDACTDCHTNPSNYAEFTCTTCHSNPETDNDHNGINGYSYNSPACLACHPTGSAIDNFDHNLTAFPLTGAHTSVDCIDCHTNGYSGTPTDCVACHTENFNQTTNPDHNNLGISTDCIACHTTEPNWIPASFDIHNNYYVLNGAHATIANDCAACHNGNYNNTPNTCFGCHESDYNSASDPSHLSAGFPTDCETCHTENNWTPSTFDHDGMYFPIYSGKHKDEWNECVECHTIPGNFGVFDCLNCHDNQNEIDADHDEVSGYEYSSSACFACHPTGDD